MKTQILSTSKIDLKFLTRVKLELILLSGCITQNQLIIVLYPKTQLCKEI